MLRIRRTLAATDTRTRERDVGTNIGWRRRRKRSGGTNVVSRLGSRWAHLARYCGRMRGGGKCQSERGEKWALRVRKRDQTGLSVLGK